MLVMVTIFIMILIVTVVIMVRMFTMTAIVVRSSHNSRNGYSDLNGQACTKITMIITVTKVKMAKTLARWSQWSL